MWSKEGSTHADIVRSCNACLGRALESTARHRLCSVRPEGGTPVVGAASAWHRYVTASRGTVPCSKRCEAADCSNLRSVGRLPLTIYLRPLQPVTARVQFGKRGIASPRGSQHRGEGRRAGFQCWVWENAVTPSELSSAASVDIIPRAGRSDGRRLRGSGFLACVLHRGRARRTAHRGHPGARVRG